LAAPAGRIHGRDIPFSAGRALEAGFHSSSIHSLNSLEPKGLDPLQQALKIPPDLIKAQQAADVLQSHQQE
jgi:hypothetical protein